MRAVWLGFALLVACTVCATQLAGAIVIREVGSGFTWAENLRCHQASDSLFVSEFKRGELYRITRSPQGFNQTVHVSRGFTIFAGLAVSEMTNDLFAIAERASDKACVIVRVDPLVPETTSVIAVLPKLANGLAIDQRSQQLFATVEADFIPLLGKIYRIDIETGSVATVYSEGFADDGAYIDQQRQLLYVSEVVGDTLLSFDVSSGSLQHETKARFPVNVRMLDDYTLSSDGLTLFGAAFWEGNVVSFAVNVTTDHPPAIILASHLRNPTSVRWGCSSSFPPSSLFVTEGGGLTSSTTDRLVLELLGVRR